MSLLSSRTVLYSFLWRYSSSFHTPRVFSNPQKEQYNLYHFSSFAGWGPQAPRKKSGGNIITEGEYKHCGQLFLPRRTGQFARLPVAVRATWEGTSWKKHYMMYLGYLSACSLGLWYFIATCGVLLLCLIICAVRLRLIFFHPLPSQLDSQTWKLVFLNDLRRSLYSTLTLWWYLCCTVMNILL